MQGDHDERAGTTEASGRVEEEEFCDDSEM